MKYSEYIKDKARKSKGNDANPTDEKLKKFFKLPEKQRMAILKKERIERENYYSNLSEELPGSDDYKQKRRKLFPIHNDRY